MKPSFLLLFISVLCSLTLQAQSNYKLTQLAHWDEPNLPVASPGNLNLKFSGCWGMTVNGREIAVMGGAAEVFFFDVTKPTMPELLARFPGGDTTVWREMKSYKNRLYAVSDGAEEGMMIFDLSNAPASIVKTYHSTEFFTRGHTITLDTISGRIYINGGSAGNGIIVLDASVNPDKPIFLGHPSLDPGLGGYVHDSYVRNDTLYCSSGWDGYYVVDFKNPNAPKLVAQCATGGYNHNSWLTNDGKFAFYTEEIPKGKPVQVIDLQRMNTEGEIEPVNRFLDNLLFPTLPDSSKLAIPHNVYIRDNFLFNSQYEDGLLVYDISNPLQPVLIANYDTHPQNSVYNGYFGNWGNFPWFPSGTIIAGDMQNGMYLLKLENVTATHSPEVFHVSFAPNPASDFFCISVDEIEPLRWSYRLLNAQGQVLRFRHYIYERTEKVETAHLPSGIYFVDIQDDTGRKKVLKVVVGG